MEDRFNQINNVISRALSIELARVTPQLKIYDINEWDSLGHVFLIHEIENAFQIKIPNREIYELASVEKIYRFLGGKRSLFLPKALTSTEENFSVQRGLKQVYFDYTRIAKLNSDTPALFIRRLPIKSFVNDLSFIEAIHYLIKGERATTSELKNYTAEFFKLSEIVRSYFLKTSILRKEHHIGIVDFLLYLREKELEYKTKFKDIEVIGGIFFCILGFVGTVPYEKNEINIILSEGLGISMKDVDVLLKCLVIQMEHGSNASSFTMRVATGAGTSYIEASCAAIMTFSGNKHGGAMKDVYNLISTLQGKSMENIDWLMEHYVRHKINIPGFGHSVYKKRDPRTEVLNEILIKIKPPYNEKVEIGMLILKCMKKYESYGLIPNVDFYTNLVYMQIGIPPALYLPLFILARQAGWSAHYKEHNNNPILIRPRLKYIDDE